VLFDAIRKFSERQADIDTAAVVEPYGVKGLTRMQRPGGELVTVASGPGVTWAPGTQLPVGSHLGGPQKVILQNPAPGRRGSSLRPPLRTFEISATGPAVHRLTPGLYQVALSDQPGTAIGVCFGAQHELVVTLHNSATGLAELDERFTLHSQEVISSTEITYLLDVDPSAPERTTFDIAVLLKL